MTIKLYCDGGSRGNPGPAAAGAVLKYDDETVPLGRFLGIQTNNFAEYSAVVMGMEAALARKPKKIEVYLDSELIVKQMNGIYRVKNVDLRPLYEKVRLMASKVPTTFTHVRREYNQEADRQVNICLDNNLDKRSS